jgi:hypothetical protein
MRGKAAWRLLVLLGNVTRVVRCGGFLLVDFVGSGVEFLVHLSLLFVFFFCLCQFTCSLLRISPGVVDLGGYFCPDIWKSKLYAVEDSMLVYMG